jgi:hypothetical protein
MTKVVLPNCTVDVTDSDDNLLSGTSRVIGNLQRDSTDSQTLSALLQGRGRPESDRPHLYRVRIDLLPNGVVPKVDDKVFVATHKTNPTLRGWYTIWNEPIQTAGLLPTMILPLHKEYN